LDPTTEAIIERDFTYQDGKNIRSALKKAEQLPRFTDIPIADALVEAEWHDRQIAARDLLRAITIATTKVSEDTSYWSDSTFRMGSFDDCITDQESIEGDLEVMNVEADPHLDIEDVLSAEFIENNPDIDCFLRSVTQKGSVSFDTADTAEDNDLHAASMIFGATFGQLRERQERCKNWGLNVEDLVNDDLRRVLLDTGATRNFINHHTVKDQGLLCFKADKPLQVALADETKTTCEWMAQVRFKFSEHYSFTTKCYVMPMGLDIDAILGMGWYNSLGPNFCDPAKCVIEFTHRHHNQPYRIKLRALNPKLIERETFKLVGAIEAKKAMRRGRKKGQEAYMIYVRPKKDNSGVDLDFRFQIMPDAPSTAWTAPLFIDEKAG